VTAVLPMTSARRAWLAIGVPVCLVVVGWIGLNLVALAGQGSFGVSHPVPASAGRVSVTISAGDVHLQPAAGETAQLTGTAHYSLVRPAFTARTTAAGTDFGYHCALPFGDCDLDATVSVPPGMAAAVRTGGGDASVTGTTGDVSLSTDGGTVSADEVSGDLTLSTGGGDVTASGITAGRVSASTRGGRVTLRFTRVPADVTVSTGGGDITIVLPPGATHYRLTEHTNGGTTSGQVPTDSSSANVITAVSDGGDISVSQS
jgi:hypothetical protein